MNVLFAQALPPDVSAIEKILPTKYVAYVTAAFFILTAIGRAITAVRNEGGLGAIWRSIFMGSATTTQAAPNNEITQFSNSPPAPSSIPKSTVCWLLIPLLGLGLLSSPGCKTSSGVAAISSTNGVLYVYGNAITTNAVQSSLKSLAASGATYAIAKDANAKAYFQTANAIISALINGGKYDSASLQTALGAISVDAVKNNAEVQNAIAAVLTVYAATEAQAVTAKVDSVAYLGAALSGINQGFNQALGVTP